MSRSGSDVSIDTFSTVDIAQRRTGLTPSGSRVTTPYSYTSNARDYLHQTKPQQHLTLSSILQHHIEPVIRAEYADNDATTPRHEGKYESFALGYLPGHEDEAVKHSRNPILSQLTDDKTPPTMEELVRSTVDDDSSSTRRSSLVQSDAVFSRPSTTRSSTSGTEFDTLTRTDTGMSIGGLGRNMPRNVPELRSHCLSTDKDPEVVTLQSVGHTEDPPSSRNGKQTRKIFFQKPSSLKIRSPLEGPQQPPLTLEGAPVSEPCDSPDRPNSSSPTKCGSLAARRQIKMDLTLPIGPPNLSDSNDLQHAHSGSLSSMTASRPRSPKTPWIRESDLEWDRGLKSKPAKTAPVIWKDRSHVGSIDMEILRNASVEHGAESMPPPVTLPLTAPAFVHPPQKVRDRCYTSRPMARGRKSGGPSTSDSEFGSTPDSHWTPEVTEGMTEREALAQNELVQLAKSAKAARSRRWPWDKLKPSGSDDQTHAQDDRDSGRRSISVNIFKRSHRFPETPVKEKAEKKPFSSMNASWRRGKPVNKPPLPSASLANMPVPPTFVPPGCEKVPTTPTFDSPSEVQGKLADFFFDSGGFTTSKRKTKASSSGYWDSNAVLMSMQTDLSLTKRGDDEEGPEGRPPAAFHFDPITGTPGPMTSPGLYTGPNGYASVKTGAAPTPGTQDSWFRMHFGSYTPDEESFTAAAMKEADERKKFEWLIPEHLPNSPLCPLHMKYVGPSKGLCYWHGRRSNGWGVETEGDYDNQSVTAGGGSNAGRVANKAEIPKADKKWRKLESLSNP